MSPQFPVDDPSRSGSLVERATSYVWRNTILRWTLVVTLINHAAAVVMAIAQSISATMAGFLGLLSVLTWFFAIALPMMNREVRVNVGAAPESYWSDLVEMFGRVVLVAQTAGYSALLIYALL